jgi:hypothetical protein
MADFTRATEVTPEVAVAIENAFEYHEWNDAQKVAGIRVRAALVAATKVIVANVPPSADRNVALRKVREAGMDAMSAIAHGCN